jgi:two-component system, NarL family, invasion response regulator UvrY
MSARPARRILMVDDHEVVRDGVKRIFEEQPGGNLFGEASTGAEALRLALERDWDVVILDLSLAGRCGFEVLKQLRRLRPALPVLILSMHSEEQYARRAFKAGAAGYVTKDSPRAELVEAAAKVMRGGRHINAALAEEFVHFFQRGAEHQPHETLSDREFEVLRLIGSGRTVGEIAGALSLSEKTISTYRARILDKMGMRNNAELMHYAIRNKLEA